MNLRFGMKHFTSIAFLLAAGPVLVAQSSGTLSGTVRDAKGMALAGARVTISSETMIAPRVLVTNDKGEWRAPLLPAGSFRVAVSKDGYVGSGAEGIRIGIGTALRQDLVLKPIQQATATVEVVSTSADVDKSDTKASVNYSADALATLPSVTRGFTGAADLSPGLTTGVNGSFSVRGGATQNTLYRVNGTDVKDDYQGAQTGTYVIEDNIEDVQVILSPLNARNGRALGGAVNVVTKSGSNSFAGSIRGQIARSGSWALPNKDYVEAGDVVSDDLNKEYQVTFNGPVIKDRLWFSLGTILKPSQSFDYSLNRPYPSYVHMPVTTGNAGADARLETGPTGYAFTKFDEDGQYKQVYDDKYYEGKLTGAITKDHTIEFNYSKSDVNLGPRNPFGDGGANISRLAALGSQTEEKQAYGWNYRGVLTSSMFLEGRWNKVDSRTVFPSGDMNYSTGELLLVYAGVSQANGGAPGGRYGLSYPFGLGISPTADRRNNRSGNLNLKIYQEIFGSNHEIDLGVDYYQAVRGTSRQAGLKNQIFRIGGAYESLAGGQYLFPAVNFTPALAASGIQDPTGLRGPAPSLQQYTGVDGVTKNTTLSFYANDQWTINNHFNVMLGLRYDSMKVVDTTGEELGNAKDISPRLQVRYDIKGDSKHLLTVTAARYGGDFTTGFTDAFIQKADGKGINYGWTGNTNNLGVGSDFGVQFYDYAAITNPLNYTYVHGYFDNTRGYKIDGDLKAPNLLEATLGYRRGWDNGSSVKITFVHREWKQDWAFKVDYDGQYVNSIEDPTGSGLLPTKYVIYQRVSNSNDLVRKYNGLELEWTGKISSIWTVNGNWTYSRLVGNNNGGDQGPGGQTFRDNAPAGYFNYRDHLVGVMGLTDAQIAPLGPLVQDQTNRGRLALTAVLPLGKGTISYSWLLRYDSGIHFNTAVTSPITPAITPIVITDAFGPQTVPGRPTTYTQFFEGRGQYSRNDTFRVDFKINYSVPLGLPGFMSKVMLIGDLMVTNLFNEYRVNNLGFGTSANAGLTAGTNYLRIDNPAAFARTNPAIADYWSSGRAFQASLGLKF